MFCYDDVYTYKQNVQGVVVSVRSVEQTDGAGRLADLRGLADMVARHLPNGREMCFLHRMYCCL